MVNYPGPGHLQVDAYMKASAAGKAKHSIVADYMIKTLGLDICADTPIDTLLRMPCSATVTMCQSCP